MIQGNRFAYGRIMRCSAQQLKVKCVNDYVMSTVKAARRTTDMRFLPPQHFLLP